MNTLKDTVDGMLSTDYKERFKAEYHQVRIRYNKLHTMVTHWDELNFIPMCDKEIYEKQLEAMLKYMLILSTRAEIENVEL